MPNPIEKDIFSKDFTVGTVVSVRCIVQSISPSTNGYGEQEIV